MSKVYYTGRRLFDGRRCVEDFAMLTEEGRILAVGPQAETACPADARRCLLEGVVTPGLLDCHVHLVSSDLAEEEPISHREMARLVCQGLRNANLLLSAGVVACRDLGSVRGCSLGIRDAIDQGIVQGPKVLAAGLSISR